MTVILNYLNVLIRYLKTDGLACGLVVFIYSRQENDRVFLAALGAFGVSIWRATGHLALDEIEIDRCPFGTTLNRPFQKGIMCAARIGELVDDSESVCYRHSPTTLA